jgi:hypothetical protein
MDAANGLQFCPNDYGKIVTTKFHCWPIASHEISRKISLIWKKRKYWRGIPREKVVLKTRDCFPSFKPQNFLREYWTVVFPGADIPFTSA